MIYVSARDRQILEILMNESEEVTIHEIAQALDVSERTIHRDISNMTPLLAPFNVKMIKKTGKGIYLEGTEKDILRLKKAIQEVKYHDFSPNERYVLIACKLLEAFEPLKLQTFATDLNVTVATISNDLEKVSEWLSKFNLKVEKRRGYGIEIKGLESDKRRAISSILAENFNESDLLNYIKLNFHYSKTDVSKAISEHLLGFIKPEKLEIVESAVDKINRELPHPIADSAYIGLVVHLALALERIQKGEKITINSRLLSELQGLKEYQFAEKLAQYLEETISVTIPDAEVCYITMHLRGAKLRDEGKLDIEDKNLDTAIKVKKLITAVSKRLDIDLTKDDSLFQGLITHLGPAMYRLEQGMAINNPILEKIKNNYPTLFTTLKECTAEVMSKIKVPEAEIGFLVLHFGSAIEQQGKDRKLNAVVICSTGIGTSKMLASRLQKEFPNIDKVKNISLFDLDKMKLDEIDLIISTLPLGNVELDYIEVNPILSPEDVKRITEYSRRRLRHSILSAGKEVDIKKEMPPSLNQQEAIDYMKQMSVTLQTTAILLENFKVYHGKELAGSTNWDAIGEVLAKLQEKDLILDQKEVLRMLKAREELSGIGIPTTQMALYHTKSDRIRQPIFLIIELEPSAYTEIKAMDGSTITLKSILLLLAPQESEEGVLQLLSYISSIIIENEESMALFQSGDEEKLSSFLSYKLTNYYREQLEKGS
ncbi:mannitol operon transcriptional antiterminator [Evansella vedderi]|uniref:Mannitol operon transcriptional antiterminator n=1 Tax=Evansella vedderi TaxID=38282 RepID=A0ABT9ZNZ4_9BACI|nr:BglG family transcription antiterminator [Evansella vedderi]MDQ0252962.1 mannitol operon transcriptional antiterminator [Evansella vedderi]